MTVGVVRLNIVDLTRQVRFIPTFLVPIPSVFNYT